MGWLFLSEIRDRKSMIAHLRRPERFGSDFELLKSTALGNTHWYLCRRKDTGFVFIGIDLMENGCATPGHGWGYKDMDESMGPCEVNCPLSYLKLASPPTGYAIEWREKVREYHRKRAQKQAVGVGTVVQYGGVCYRLQRPVGPRLGWNVARTTDGAEFRMKARQVAAAQVVGGANAS